MGSFTAAQRISLHQIIGVPYLPSGSNPAMVMDDAGFVADQQIVTATQSVNTEITAFLAAVDVDVETAIKALITRFDAIGTSVSTIIAGNLGDMTGVTNDP